MPDSRLYDFLSEFIQTPPPEPHASPLEHLDWKRVREHYKLRARLSQSLRRLAAARDAETFASLALGLSDQNSNYSASEHFLGPQIIQSNHRAHERVLALAEQFVSLKGKEVARVPNIIQRAGLKYLAIGVGSEISCMVNPNVCWVANTRTIWAHLVVKHDGNPAIANEALSLYRQGSDDSEMQYDYWRAIHGELGKSLPEIASQGTKLAKETGIAPGNLTFLWADAIADTLYERYAHT